MKTGMTAIVAALFLVLPGRSPAGESEDLTLRLSVGNQRYKDKIVHIRPGSIVSARTGRAMPEKAVLRDLQRADFVYIGETHDSLPMHEVQLRVLQALHGAGGKDLAVGVEMFPASSQAVLDRWSGGELSEEDFLRASRWYVTWNFHWGYYNGLFDFARRNAVPVVGLNVAREIIAKIRRGGWASLSDEEKTLVPEPDLSNPDHRALMKAVFSGENMPPQMRGEGFEKVFEGLYRAQSAWDEVMASNADRASDSGKRKVLVLAGSGHLIYNLGINRRVFERNGRPFRTVVCVSVPRDRPSVAVSRSLADYIWGLAEEERPAFPSVGLRLKTFDGLANLVVEAKPADGVARGRDFEKGDVILSVDGMLFSDLNELRMHLARYGWGEEAAFRLLRSGQEKTAVLKFDPPASPAEADKTAQEGRRP
ncbi:MAG: ChaN family lipoprotein [Candidatus Aminicenantes bacterium]|nr:ChaN family lipoprotein [Candidatus Aminicenantes bacterium]